MAFINRNAFHQKEWLLQKGIASTKRNRFFLKERPPLKRKPTTKENGFHEKGWLPLKASLLKSHFGVGVRLKICCILSEHLSLGTPLRTTWVVASVKLNASTKKDGFH